MSITNTSLSQIEFTLKEINLNFADNIDRLKEAHDTYLEDLNRVEGILRGDDSQGDRNENFRVGTLVFKDNGTSVLDSLETMPPLCKTKNKRN